MTTPLLTAYLSLVENYKMPDDIPVAVEYARDCVREHIRKSSNNLERQIAQFCEELRMLPAYTKHFGQDGKHTSFFGKSLQDLNQNEMRKIFLAQIVMYERLYAWRDYFLKSGCTEKGLRDKLTIFKCRIGEGKFGFGYEDYEKNFDLCKSTHLAQELIKKVKLVLREDEDHQRTDEQLFFMKKFEDNWWVARPSGQPATEKPAKLSC